MWILLLQAVSKGTIGSIFSHKIGHAILNSYIINRQDMGMLEHIKKLGFLQKVVTLLLRTEIHTMQNFNSHHTFRQEDMYPAIDTSKGATSQFVNNTIVAN